ncbi:MAG: NlpC/P60 family protein [Planctomycetota bacterium]|jgi:hypothetical protein
MNRREAALWVWERQLGEPYLWAGDDPLGGFDCSGLAGEGLRSVGVIGRADRYASFQLAEMWQATTDIKPGCLLFWNRRQQDGSQRIGHVEIVWRVLDDGTVLTIGASGGGRKTDTLQDAIDSDAYVKIREAVKPWVKAVDPFA